MAHREEMMFYYIELDGKVVAEEDMLIWSRWFEKADRIVKVDNVGTSRVSTVFLGIDHNLSSSGPPILYETMIFGPYTDYCDRYATREEALIGHELAKQTLLGNDND